MTVGTVKWFNAEKALALSPLSPAKTSSCISARSSRLATAHLMRASRRVRRDVGPEGRPSRQRAAAGAPSQHQPARPAPCRAGCCAVGIWGSRPEPSFANTPQRTNVTATCPRRAPAPVKGEASPRRPPGSLAGRPRRRHRLLTCSVCGNEGTAKAVSGPRGPVTRSSNSVSAVSAVRRRP
jgi:hypothetical protein